MEFLRIFTFKIVAPLIWLSFFAYAFAIGGIQLAGAWKAKNFKKIWLNIWIMLVGLYFLVYGG